MAKIVLEGTHNDIDIEFSSGIVRKARLILEVIDPIIHDLELPAGCFEGNVVCNIAFRAETEAEDE